MAGGGAGFSQASRVRLGGSASASTADWSARATLPEGLARLARLTSGVASVEEEEEEEVEREGSVGGAVGGRGRGSGGF